MAGRVNVYGIGNALVDIQYRVEPEYLGRMQIEKGVMTLIEEARHHELVQGLQELSSERASGGSAANTMIAMANMGGSAYYGCKVARDEFGDFYLNDLEAAGVASDPSNRGEGITGKVPGLHHARCGSDHEYVPGHHEHVRARTDRGGSRESERLSLH